MLSKSKIQKRKRRNTQFFSGQKSVKFHPSLKVIDVSKENSGPALYSPWWISFEISRPLRKDEIFSEKN